MEKLCGCLVFVGFVPRLYVREARFARQGESEYPVTFTRPPSHRPSSLAFCLRATGSGSLASYVAPSLESGRRRKCSIGLLLSCYGSPCHPPLAFCNHTAALPRCLVCSICRNTPQFHSTHTFSVTARCAGAGFKTASLCSNTHFRENRIQAHRVAHDKNRRRCATLATLTTASGSLSHDEPGPSSLFLALWRIRTREDVGTSSASVSPCKGPQAYVGVACHRMSPLFALFPPTFRPLHFAQVLSDNPPPGQSDASCAHLVRVGLDEGVDAKGKPMVEREFPRPRRLACRTEGHQKPTFCCGRGKVSVFS